MKKDDIINQKLFETNSLSHFYLDMILNCKWEDESPLLLANAYKQKLYEIVDRYDRLLDLNKQREQLCLSFEKHKPPRYNQTHNKSFTSQSHLTTRTSTPNKCLPNNNNNNNNNNINNSQNSKSNCSSYASTPTTPCQPRTFVRSSSSSSSSNFALNSQQRGYKSPYNQARSSFNLNSRQSKSHSNSKLELEQRIASIYYDDFDIENETENENENEHFYNTSSFQSNHKIAHDSTKLPFFIRTKETTDNYTEHNETYASETDYHVDELDVTNRSQTNIEKSFSNLSKDSGVLIDSYHSDYSNCVFSGGACLSKMEPVNKNLIDDLDGVECDPGPDEALTKSQDDIDSYKPIQGEDSNTSSNPNSTSPSSNEEDDDRQSFQEKLDSFDQNSSYRFSDHNEDKQVTSQNLSLKKIFNSKLEGRRSVNNIGLLNLHNNRINYNLSNRTLNAKNQTSVKKGLKKNLNLDLKFDFSNGLDTSNLVSLLVESSNDASLSHHSIKNQSLVEQYKRSNNILGKLDESYSNGSLNSSVSTPSPSSSTTSNSSSNESNYENDYDRKFLINKNNNNANSNTNNDNIVSASSVNNLSNCSANLLKSINPFFFNYNSLMNVSMLDSIQVTNNNLDLDTMSSSILMFN